jgi:hypothetical protein
MKRISENGARPVSALGEPLAQPFGRLGALVFQPITRIRLCWASLRAQTRIAGCAAGQKAADTRWENVLLRKTLLSMGTGTHKQLERRQRRAPASAVKVLLATCPRALLRSTLTAQASAQKAAARNCLWKNALRQMVQPIGGPEM